MKQKTYINTGAVQKLESIINELNSNRFFLVTGKKSYLNSGAKEVIQKYLKNKEIIHFNDFSANPDYNDLVKGINIFKTNKCDAIISVGGGSVIDMAKLIDYYGNYENINMLNTASSLVNHNYKKSTHICLPTTAGSGSEATHFAVLYINKTKYSVANPELIPDYVIIAPDLHKSQTKYQKVVSGLDAVCQAIESAWSIYSTEESKKYAFKALEILWTNLPENVNNNSFKAMENTAIAANLAGKAINITKTTAAHALSYSFTSQYNIPHGHAVALTIPYFLEFNYDINKNNCMDKRGHEYVKNTLNQIYSIIGASDNYNAKQVMENFIKNLAADTKIQFNPEIIIKGVNEQRLSNNPKKILKSDLKNLLNTIVKNA